MSNAKSGDTETTIPRPAIADVEDLVTGGYNTAQDAHNDNGFDRIHDEAVRKGRKTYVDPATGYQVFTSLAHNERGWCCGSGCRHCPYSHTNVKGDNKAQRIQQPSYLYQSTGTLFAPAMHQHTKVLFFSGGKDSFLTIRKLVRQYHALPEDEQFGLVLLTTFDATSRKIAHQEVPIDDVMRQAQHLDITLLGIPLRRGSGEPYRERIERGLALVTSKFPTTNLSSLVFGDLHLEHIKDWRDKTFAKSEVYRSCRLEYPLWKVPYQELLEDLQASQVPCFLSATTTDQTQVGSRFDSSLYEEAISKGLDGFGERGEFHSMAQVWEVPREVALGIPTK